MAKLTREDVLHLARLAKLTLSDEEVERYTQELGEVLAYVEQLQNVDVDGLKPTYQVTGLENVMREDEVKLLGPTPEELLKNAPAVSDDGHIQVKRVLA